MLNNCRKKADADIKAYHFIQTFAKDDDITPEEAHKIGMEFIEKLFTEKHAFVCAIRPVPRHMPSWNQNAVYLMHQLTTPLPLQDS